MRINKSPGGSAPSNIEEDYTPSVSGEVSSRFLPGASVEIIHETLSGIRDSGRRTRFEHVLFDFDGTLSLIRQGWPEVTVGMMTEEILATGTGETPGEISRHFAKTTTTRYEKVNGAWRLHSQTISEPFY